ncbi:Glutamate--tRNA ligase [Buchnera aphidicola (Thelaxes suberi)]|uniref:glutamate--tRNA ligase n=1 Tax=Buchnera aphidicola TaxID=9 RepID=UPI0034639B56
MKVVTRFAPSPTGFLHIGNIRTALYSWLFSQHYNGIFILRIEDTNIDKSHHRYSQSILNTLKWLGLHWDKGPYYQSNNIDYYRDMINVLIRNNQAYKCYCSPERLKRNRDNQIKLGKKPKYDGKCKHSFIKKKKDYVIRFNNPDDGKIVFNDLIRGKISVNNTELDDLIIQRSNGMPTYNFCAVLDDNLMNVTHVIRGEDHINNTPRQINIYNAFNFSLPFYAHVSMILDSDKKKLSKRNNSSNILYYRDQGFFPEALLNYIVRLGWSYGNQEIFSLKEMVQLFSLRNINKSPSIFNIKKLYWINRFYLNKFTNKKLIPELEKQMQQRDIKLHNNVDCINILTIFKSRCNTLKEVLDLYENLNKNINLKNTQYLKLYLSIFLKDAFVLIFKKLNFLLKWEMTSIQYILKQALENKKLKVQELYAPLRLILTGTLISPNINHIIFILGKNIVLHRIRNGINYILLNKK